MDNSLVPALEQARLAIRTAGLQKSNETAELHGLSLSDSQMRGLILAEDESLRAMGRLEFGEGILPRLMYSFCDSPYISRDSWMDTLLALQELFYTFKNELYDALTDDELLEAMNKIFHGRAQGSLVYLENMATDMLLKALRSDGDEDDDDD
ncbi:MAG TPA: DUF6323 family protein [Candidatus Limiplasma sp.]|nr:DUF6323 family protein [Candidatus Limiplasma sp.]HRX09805.1 DUF6323 family protein [Candidatus Limiplasma sp.]